ncbi:hypothetical protein [Shewanella gaetbuli]
MAGVFKPRVSTLRSAVPDFEYWAEVTAEHAKAIQLGEDYVSPEQQAINDTYLAAMSKFRTEGGREALSPDQQLDYDLTMRMQELVDRHGGQYLHLWDNQNDVREFEKARAERSALRDKHG